MLYSEFINGTGCKDNTQNYNLYRELEIIYMNTDCSKDHIYEMGRKLAYNCKTQDQLEFEAKIRAEIEELKDYIRYYKAEAERYAQLIAIEDDPMWKETWKRDRRHAREQVRQYRSRIEELKWVLI